MTSARPMSLDEVNAMTSATFVAAFGGVAEHAPWVAGAAARKRPFADRETMIAAFGAAIRDADRERQLALLRAHPDLAGRAALAGEVTEASASEQAGAGLDSLTATEMATFSRLNDRYRARFGFPFILAVRGATKADILGAYAGRVDRAPADEFATALDQVARIVRFRLEDRVAA